LGSRQSASLRSARLATSTRTSAGDPIGRLTSSTARPLRQSKTLNLPALMKKPGARAVPGGNRAERICASCSTVAASSGGPLMSPGHLVHPRAVSNGRFALQATTHALTSVRLPNAPCGLSADRPTKRRNRLSAALCKLLKFLSFLERAKGFEPSTPTLARLCSTTELHPHPCRHRQRVGT
jgi:hypothetical protein